MDKINKDILVCTGFLALLVAITISVAKHVIIEVINSESYLLFAFGGGLLVALMIPIEILLVVILHALIDASKGGGKDG